MSCLVFSSLLFSSLLFSSLLWGSVGTAFGGAYVPIPTIDPVLSEMPNYFSGTNCQASGWVYVDPPPPGQSAVMMTAYLYVGDELVKEWHNLDPNGEPVAGAFMDAVFDSTHFDDGESVEVKVIGYDSLNRSYVDSESSVIKNKAIVYARQDLEGDSPYCRWYWIHDDQEWALLNAGSRITDDTSDALNLMNYATTVNKSLDPISKNGGTRRHLFQITLERTWSRFIVMETNTASNQDSMMATRTILALGQVPGKP